MPPFFPGVFHRPGIYAIVHVLSGTRYVGQSGDLLRRFEQHWELLQLAKHHNPRLQKTWDGDGPDAFEFKVVELAPSELEGMRLQRWLAAREGDHIATFKKRGFAFNIVDAEVVQVSAGHRRQKFVGQLAAEPARPIHSITEALRDLSLESDRLKKAASASEAAASNHRDTVLPRMRADAQARLFGVLSIVSAAEVKRRQVAQAALDAAIEEQTKLDEAAFQAKASLENSVAQGRALRAAYPGNQARTLKRQSRRARYGF
jgi:hypothetical protein